MDVGVDDLLDVIDFVAVFRCTEAILTFVFGVVLAGVDEEHVVGLFTFLEHEDANRDAR